MTRRGGLRAVVVALGAAWLAFYAWLLLGSDAGPHAAANRYGPHVDRILARVCRWLGW